MTPILFRQLNDLNSTYPGSSVTQLPSGAHLIEVPNVPLPSGWDRAQVTVYFVAPPGYPVARPDCFWTDLPFLRLANNPQTPLNSNEINLIPEVSERKGTWFSWHLQSWNPNQDSLRTFVNVIKLRLNPAR
jgi:hypothetical protein